MNIIKSSVFLALIFGCTLPLTSQADDAGDTAKGASGVAHESAASFDKRLPPVLPGEEIVRDGKSMKVWSSSGPVVVADAPDPSHTPGQQLPAGVGVIVDQRDDHKSGRVP